MTTPRDQRQPPEPWHPPTHDWYSPNTADPYTPHHDQIRNTTPCPRCGAPPGAYCATKTGNPTSTHHPRAIAWLNNPQPPQPPAVP